MKKLFSALLAIFCVGLVLAGCSAAPAAEEVEAPCLPGLAWGMTKEEACEALGWAEADITETPTEGGDELRYGQYSIKQWGIPFSSVGLGENEDGLINCTIFFTENELEAVLRWLQDSGLVLEEKSGQWLLKGPLLEAVATKQELDRMLEIKMEQWRETVDIEAALKASVISTEEELIAKVEESTRKELEEAALYGFSITVQEFEGAETYILQGGGRYAVMLSNMRNGKS